MVFSPVVNRCLFAFRFSMPITVEDVYAYMVDKYYGKENGLKLEKVDLNAECLVKFNWK